MKYVRMKSGEIDIMEDGESIPAGSETIFSTDPSVYEGTWDKPASGLGRVDVEMAGGKERIVKPLPGDPDRDVSYVGTAKERKEGRMVAGKRTGIAYDPEKKLFSDMKGTGWTEPHKAHPQDKVCLNCGKPMLGVRPNRKFCSENCRKRYSERIKRAEKRAIKQFRPHMGKEGQIYVYVHHPNRKGVHPKDIREISFIPALWCDSPKRVEKYIKANYPAEVQEVVLEQVKEVMKK